ncbi:MAG TPA: malto-oligosyltrehalose trehalohydrolase [Chloroflexota bacterium]
MTELNPQPGATLTADGVRFAVWAPAARSVEVELVASGNKVALARDAAGVWSATVPPARSGARYVYRLNGEIARPDPYSRFQPEGVHGPSEVLDPKAFAWSDAGWRGLRIQGLVIYQVHVGAFTPEGTLDALRGQLARLKALGVSAIQLLPVAEFPGERNWGYDGVDLFAVEHVYGGPDALKRLVDDAHGVGLGVILDVVYNHFGPDGNYLRDFSPDYFTDRYHTPWGDAVNFDGPNSAWVREMLVDNARYWIGEYHADGLRLDATHAIHDASPRHILAEITAAARDAAGSDRAVVLIAETGENDVRYLRTVQEDGFGFDAVYADDFHHALRRYLAGDHEGYYADFDGTLDEVARCIMQGWLYEGQPTRSSNGERRRGTPARDRPAWQFLYALQNHDQVGNRAFGDRLHHQIGNDRFAVASALLLFLPYTPMLFMGQEFAATSPFQFFTDHNPELGRLVTEGRRREFRAFSAFADPSARDRIPDPQAEATFNASKLRAADAASPAGVDYQRWYAELLDLRHTDAVLADQSRERLSARALTADVLAVRRWSASQERLLLVNFGDTALETPEFGGGWRIVLSRGEAASDAEGVSVATRSAAILARSA